MFLKRQLPVILAFVAGMVLWAQFYIPSHASQHVLEVFTTSWAIIISGGALVLGLLSAVHYHWTKVALRRPGFGFSIVTLLTFGFVAAAGWFPAKPVPWSLWVSLVFLGIAALVFVSYLFRRGRDPAAMRLLTAAGLLASLGLLGALVIYPMQLKMFTTQTIQPGSLFDWIFLHVFVALDATMFSLLAFFIASAAFRAFRARTPEATALLIAGCIVMLGRVPVGEWLGKIPHTQIDLPAIASWILNEPNAAAQRGILLGVILSQVAISLRIIFGIERTYMGGGD